MNIDEARSILEAQPFNRVIGARLESFGDGRAVLEIDIADRHRQQFGLVHGGVWSYAADNALTFAAGSVLGPDVLTGGVTVNYLRPASTGTITARATVARATSRRAVCTAEVFNISDQHDTPMLCAIAQGWVSRTNPPAPERNRDEVRSVVTRLYDAFAAADVAALAGLLHPDFTGRVSAGMPGGVGGRVDDPGHMLNDVWGSTFARFDTAPEPDEVVLVDAHRAIVTGFYRGRHRSTERPYEAAFTHDITVRNGKIHTLTQVTDTKPWHDAMAAAHHHDTE